MSADWTKISEMKVDYK